VLLDEAQSSRVLEQTKGHAMTSDKPSDSAALEYECEQCGFVDTVELRDGINNHWRKGYVEELRPRSEDAICYGWTKLLTAVPTKPEVK